MEENVLYYGDNLDILRRILRTWWRKVGGKFPSVQTGGYIIMPNHFQGIVNIVGSALCGRPNLDNNSASRQPHGVAPTGYIL